MIQRASYFRSIDEKDLLGFYIGGFVNLFAAIGDSDPTVGELFLVFEYMYRYSEGARALMGIPADSMTRWHLMYRGLLPG